MGKYIGTARAAKEWDVSARSIERYIKAGRLKAKKFGQRYKILLSDWEEFKVRNLKDVA